MWNKFVYLSYNNGTVIGYKQPQLPMVDYKYQQKGYGEAAMQELIRSWLKSYPEVESIATSYRQGNKTASKLKTLSLFWICKLGNWMGFESQIVRCFLKLNFWWKLKVAAFKKSIYKYNYS